VHHKFENSSQANFSRLYAGLPVLGVRRSQRQSADEVHALEQEVAARFPELTAGLEAAGLRQERRVMRLRPLNPALIALPGGDLQFRFDLPRGTYATTVLSELAELLTVAAQSRDE
jgi:tRNA pseudouridine13 synthase